MGVLLETIPVNINRILNAVISKDHSNALVLLDTLATTMGKLVKVNFLHLITFNNSSIHQLLSE